MEDGGGVWVGGKREQEAASEGQKLSQGDQPGAKTKHPIDRTMTPQLQPLNKDNRRTKREGRECLTHTTHTNYPYLFTNGPAPSFPHQVQPGQFANKQVMVTRSHVVSGNNNIVRTRDGEF